VTAFRSGFVGLAGRPNVGKSTLVNALCGSHVAIVSDKPQTTRRRILGVAHEPGAQLILADLPGFQRPRDALTQRMQRAVDESLRDVDAALFVIDATEEIGAGDRFVAGRVYAGELPVVVALNKVDRLRPPQIAAAIERAAVLGPFHALHPISARTGDGVEALRRELVELLPEGPPYFDEAQDSDQPVALRIAELVREQALHLTRQEVPHAVAVTVEELDRPKGRRPGRVTASLLVETESQQRILVGKHGSVVRAIGEGSRPEIESLLGGQIFLDLRVKVRPRWRRDDALLDRYDL
jgi:GTP-binding protein Era